MKARRIAQMNVPTIDIIKGMGGEKKRNEDNYLECLSFTKAKQIYGDLLPEEISDRLKYELQIIMRCAFNKSHSVCYTWLAYQMAYLKANYSKEFAQVMEK